MTVQLTISHTGKVVNISNDNESNCYYHEVTGTRSDLDHVRLSHVPIVETKSRVSNAETIDGNPVTTNTSANTSGGDANGPSERNDGFMRAEVLDNEESSFEIK